MLLIERWVLREMFIVAASVRAFLLPLCAIQNAAVTSRSCDQPLLSLWHDLLLWGERIGWNFEVSLFYSTKFYVIDVIDV